MAKMLVPALTFPVRGAMLFVATMPVPASPSGGHIGTPDRSVPLGSRRRAPSSVSRPAAAPAGHGGQDVVEPPGLLADAGQLVEPRRHRAVELAGREVDGEHAAGVTDAEHLLAGQLPVHVAGQRRQVRDAADVLLAVQDRLVDVGDAPPVRDVVAEQFGQFAAGVVGVRVAPGAERHEQLPVAVEREVAVHHGRDAEGSDGAQRHSVPALDVGRELGVAVLQARPDASRS